MHLHGNARSGSNAAESGTDAQALWTSICLFMGAGLIHRHSPNSWSTALCVPIMTVLPIIDVQWHMYGQIGTFFWGFTSVRRLLPSPLVGNACACVFAPVGSKCNPSIFLFTDAAHFPLSLLHSNRHTCMHPCMYNRTCSAEG